MTDGISTRFEPRPTEEVTKELLERARHNRKLFLYIQFDEAAPAINGLGSVDHEGWSKAFSALALPHEERAAKAEA